MIFMDDYGPSEYFPRRGNNDIKNLDIRHTKIIKKQLKSNN